MDNDDVILRQILTKEAAQRSVRPTFARDVLRRLPERKRPFASRRTLLIASFTLFGCAAASFIAWSALMTFLAGFLHLMDEMNTVKQSLMGTILASPLAFILALLTLTYAIAKRSKLI